MNHSVGKAREPVRSSLRTHDGFVEDLSLAKHCIQRQLAHLRAHSSLCQLRHGEFRVFDAIRGFVGVCDLDIEHAVQVQRYVVCDRMVVMTIEGRLRTKTGRCHLVPTLRDGC